MARYYRPLPRIPEEELETSADEVFHNNIFGSSQQSQTQSSSQQSFGHSQPSQTPPSSQPRFRYSQQSQTPPPPQRFRRSQGSQYETPTGRGSDPIEQPAGSWFGCENRSSSPAVIFKSFVHWVAILLLATFAFGSIAIISIVSLQSNSCPIRKQEQTTNNVIQLKTSTSFSPASSPHSNPVYTASSINEVDSRVVAKLFNQTESKGSIWIRKNFARIKGWMSWIIHWISENCSLECVLAKLGIWVEDNEN